jgi:NADH:ubiquinone oxidoreductase subunit 5 (subunit L)/multisubunit Na+/H+ antiporter MnhA subunit
VSAAVLLAVALLPALGGLAAALSGARGAARVGTAATAAAFLAAVVVLGLVAAGEPVAAVAERADGSALLGLHAGELAAVLLLLVTGVSAVVQAFAARYLHGDVRARRFFAATGALTAATAAMVAAATLVGLAVAWTAAGIALVALLRLYRGLPAADEGARRTARAFAIGDGALWLAVAISLTTWGSIDLRTLGATAPELAADGTALAVVACLLVVAALARSAQLPLHGWLPATLAAPTPVSALLHAGVVNGGGVLLAKMSPLFAASSPATHLAFTAGALTVLYGTTLMLTKPDVKGALAHSTMGQMGFMVMTCGLGAFVAAIVHLVAHGMYKATLFLGSGAAVHRHVRHTKAPPAAAQARSERVRAAVLAALVPGAAIGLAAVLLKPDMGGSAGSGTALLLFAWATAAWAGWGWLQRGTGARRTAAFAGATAAGSVAYVAMVTGVASFLAPSFEGAGTATVSAWLLVPVVAAIALGTLARMQTTRELHKTLYVLALGAGHVTARRARRATRPRALAPAPLGGLVARSEGGRA